MSTLQLPGSLVSAAWLQQHLEHDDLLLFDASWHMPATARDGLAEWQQERISGGTCQRPLVTALLNGNRSALVGPGSSTSTAGSVIRNRVCHICCQTQTASRVNCVRWV